MEVASISVDLVRLLNAILVLMPRAAGCKKSLEDAFVTVSKDAPGFYERFVKPSSFCN